jgi:hypothetical protein
MRIYREGKEEERRRETGRKRKEDENICRDGNEEERRRETGRKRNVGKRERKEVLRRGITKVRK